MRMPRTSRDLRGGDGSMRGRQVWASSVGGSVHGIDARCSCGDHWRGGVGDSVSWPGWFAAFGGAAAPAVAAVPAAPGWRAYATVVSPPCG